MMDLNDLVTVLASSFFGGSTTVAGMVIFVAVIAIVFALFKDTRLVLIIMMPIALIFSLLGILGTDMTVLLIIVAVLGLATTARDTWRSRGLGGSLNN